MSARSARLLPILLAACLLPPGLSGQDLPPDPELRTTGIELSIGGRVQTQYNTTSLDAQPPSQLFIRRARIELGVRVSDRVTGVIQPDFGGEEVELKDANLQLALSPGVRLLAGKAYRPFGLLEQTSSKRMAPVERGLRIRGVSGADEYALLSGLGYSNRDIGIQVGGAPEGAPRGLEYALGMFRGPLHGQVGAQDSYQFAGRVTADASESLRVGAGWSTRHFAEPGGAGTPRLERGNAFEVDAEYGSFSRGLHVLAELSMGDVDPFADATFIGGQAWVAYRFEDAGRTLDMLEPVLRMSFAETDGVGVVPGGGLVTPGINLYITPLNRIMFNYDIWMGADGSPDARSFKAMFQLGF